MGFEIPDLQMSSQIEVRKERRTGNNVLARLKAPGEAQKAVVVGAHVDHLGRGRGAGSLARAQENGMIHYGADDNASGVGGILEIAQYLAGVKQIGEAIDNRNSGITGTSFQGALRKSSDYHTV